jgi:protein-S-isoprenylcysteine O-methyltransferase Ste14
MTIAPDHAQVIARQERYLERTFGEDYRACCRRVRRWL